MKRCLHALSIAWTKFATLLFTTCGDCTGLKLGVPDSPCRRRFSVETIPTDVAIAPTSTSGMYRLTPRRDLGIRDWMRVPISLLNRSLVLGIERSLARPTDSSSSSSVDMPLPPYARSRSRNATMASSISVAATVAFHACDDLRRHRRPGGTRRRVLCTKASRRLSSPMTVFTPMVRCRYDEAERPFACILPRATPAPRPRRRLPRRL